MKKTVIFGSGQIGSMVGRLLGTEYRIICYADNNVKRHGELLNGYPICSPEASIKENPDCVCIGVLDEERASQMETQLREMGFTGELLRPNMLKAFDTRVGMMRLLAEQLEERHICGDVAEVGVFRGEFAALINQAFPSRKLHLFDTFSGFTKEDIDVEQEFSLSRAKVGDFSETTEDAVRDIMSYPQNVVLHKGFFPDTFAGCEKDTYAFLSLDVDLYAPTAAALPLFWPRMSTGGVIIVHDYNSTQFTGARKAVQEFCSKENICPIPICDLHGSVLLMKF